jgi:hypothetical protein
MGNIIVSMALRKNVVAILVQEDGVVKAKSTERIKDEKALASSYSGIIYAFAVALRYTRQYLQDNKSNKDVCFETSNSTFIKWVDNQYSKELYQEEFVNVLKLLQELPIRYTFSYNPKPKAFTYADEKYCKKETVSGLNLDDYE